MQEHLKQVLEVISQAEHHIAEGEVERALRLARAAEDFPDPEALILQLLSRWNTVERKMLESLISDDDFRVERAQITKRLTQFLLETKDAVETELLGAAVAPIESGGELALPDYDGKPQILVLYALDDESVLKELQKHLFLAMRDEALQFVDVHQAVPVVVKAPEQYQERLVEAARTVIALVTPNTMSLPIFPLAERALEVGKLIPIRVDEVGLEGSPFRLEIAGLPKDGGFINDRAYPNGAWVEVAQELQAFFKKIKEEA
ncbi:MAG: hypothetical protein AAFO02_23675 [Bacteroidota bacterium]